MADFERNSRFSRIGKAIDISTLAGEKSRIAFKKSKEKAKHSTSVDENTPEQYASSQIQDFIQEITDDSAYTFNQTGKNATKTTVSNIQNIKAKKAAIDIEKSKKGTSASQGVANVPLSVENIKHTDTHSTPYAFKRDNVKNFSDNFISMQKTNKAVNKKAIQNYQVSKTAKKSQKAAQVTRQTAHKSREFIRKSAKATRNAIKTIIDGTKALINAIIAGGWLSVVIIILLCLVSALAGSFYGIFFSTEASESGMNISTAIQEINADYDNRIDSLKSSGSYDSIEINGSKANWKDVLSIYAVKVTTDPDNPMEIATVDENKKSILSNIFWDMNNIDSKSETRTETREITSTDENGDEVITTEDITVKVLTITINSKNADEMAQTYSFNDKQKTYLAELMNDSNDKLWASIIFSTGNTNVDIDIGSLDFGNETVNDTQRKIVAVALDSESYGISAKSGYCQAWVADVYQAVTGSRGSAHCALCAADMWAVSDDWSKIPVGATVYGYASNPYGHVGIYIGNGQVIHNLSGTVKVHSLESWVKDFKGFAWGWENGIGNCLLLYQ